MFRTHLKPLALWTVLWALFFGTLLLGVDHLPDGDFFGQFYAFARFQAEEVAAGRLPLWSPGSQGGFPFVADPQAAVFYPLRWLTLLLSLPGVFSLYLLELEALVHVWLAGAFTYALAFSITRNRTAALLGALTFALGGYLISYPLLQLALLETITWLPLVLLLLRQAVKRERPTHWLFGAGLVLGLSLTAGHPQTFLHVAYMAAAYYLFLAWQQRWNLRWLLGGGLLVALPALGVAAVAWLPALRLMLNSTRSDVTYQFVASGLPLLDYLQVVLPGVRSFWSPVYLGAAGLLLALLAWFGRERGDKDEIVFWSVIVLLTAWLALGDQGVLFQLIYHIAPGFSLFRQQERLIGLSSLAAALLTAQGFHLWLTTDASSRRRWLRAAGLVAVLGLLVGASYLMVAPALEREQVGQIWVRQALLFLTVFLLLWQRRRQRLVVIALVLLVGADLYLGSYPEQTRQPGSPRASWTETEWIDMLQAETGPEPPSRIDGHNLFHANLGELFGLEDIRGISPLRLQLAAAFESIPEPRRWQLLGVSHVLGHEAPDVPLRSTTPISGSPITQYEFQATLYRLANPLPRAWFSFQPLVAADAAQALDLLKQPDFDPATQVVLQPPLPPALDELTLPSIPPVVTTRQVEANHLQIETSSEQPGLLVISEWAYPGWQATVDGERVPLYPANYGFQTLAVPAGQHQISFRFIPPDVILGSVISGLSLLVVLLLLWRWQPAVQYRSATAGAGILPRPRAWPVRLSRQQWRWLLLTFLLLGFGLRLFHLGVQNLRGDEAFSYLYARQPLLDVAPTLAADGDPHPPLHYMLLSGWMSLAGDSEFALRFPSAAGSLLLLALLFQLGRSVLNRRLGLLMIIMATVSQSLVWLGQDVRNQYILVLIFSVLATLLLLRALEARGPRWWFFYAVACALTMYSHYYGLFVLLAHGLMLLSTADYRRRFGQWLLAGLAALLLFLPWLLAGRSGWQLQLFDPGGDDLGAFLLATGQELTVGPAMAGSLGRWVFVIALAPALLGLRHLWQRRPAMAVLLGGWLAGTAWGIFLILLRRSTFNSFYIIVAAPAWWALVGSGLLTLWRRRGGWRPLSTGLPAAGLLLIVAFNAAGLGRYYTDPNYYGRAQGYRSLADYVAAHAEPGDLLMPNFPDPVIDYYFRDSALPRQMQPADVGQTAAEIESNLAALATRHHRIWFVPAHRSTWDPEDVVFRWLDYHTLLEEQRTFGDVSVQAYRPLSTTTDLLFSVNASAGPLHLEGTWVTVEGVPLSLEEGPVNVPAGSTVDVSLIWQAEAVPQTEYTVFVHLLDAEGRLVGQHDGVPAHGTRPTTTWEQGERLLDEHRVQIAPDATGSGWITVGLYETTTLERQPFNNGEEVIRLAPVQFISRE